MISAMPARALHYFSYYIINIIFRYDNIIQLIFFYFYVTFKINLADVVYYLKLFQRYLILCMISVTPVEPLLYFVVA